MYTSYIIPDESHVGHMNTSIFSYFSKLCCCCCSHINSHNQVRGRRICTPLWLTFPQRAPVKLHVLVRARFFRFARKFNNSELCVAAPYVQVRTKRRLRCPDQPDPKPDSIPNPNPNPNPKTTPNPNPNPSPNPTPTL